MNLTQTNSGDLVKIRCQNIVLIFHIK